MNSVITEHARTIHKDNLEQFHGLETVVYRGEQRVWSSQRVERPPFVR